MTDTNPRLAVVAADPTMDHYVSPPTSWPPSRSSAWRSRLDTRLCNQAEHLADLALLAAFVILQRHRDPLGSASQPISWQKAG